MESVTIVFLHLYLIHEAIKIEGRTSILARECAFGRTSYVSKVKKIAIIGKVRIRMYR